jgi:hypothetical protein
MSYSRTKLKQADWPLCSKSNVNQNLTQNTMKKFGREKYESNDTDKKLSNLFM